jgi:hypothetical protein
MIEINKQEIGGKFYEVFTLLNEGYITNGVEGWVQMECRISDMDCEGNQFFIGVLDDNVVKNGDYSPLSMEKSELKQFIDYLQKRYEEMPDEFTREFAE